MNYIEDICDLVDALAAEFTALSDRVWAMPEIAYHEYRSAAEHLAVLRAHEFRVTTDVAGIPTALVGEAGSGGPIIAIMGEFDALPGLGQEAGVAEARPLGGNGHGCGHNLLGAGALHAAVAVKQWLGKANVPGRVRYYGCPAEEGGAAKTFMVRAGAFDDVDIAITWHPDAFTEVARAESLANTRMDFRFTGRASHAAMAPHMGRSALDAVELMNVGVNYLREHVPSDSRIHYAILDAGGIAPNVVQATAAVRYAIRSRDLKGMFALNERVRKVAQGAAMMTETKVDISIMSAVSNLLPNRSLEEAMQRNMDRLGPVPFDDADRDYAGRIQGTLGDEDIEAAFRSVGIERREGSPLCEFVVPLDVRGVPMIGSTDVGDVSWVVPTVQAHAATMAIGTPGHSWQVTTQGKSPAAHKGMVYAAKVMASIALDAINNPSLVAAARNEHRRRLSGSPYVCPIPGDVVPPVPVGEGPA